MANVSDSEKRENIRESVRKAYAQIAVKGKSCCVSGNSCCGAASPTALARGIGYSEAELAGLPEEANMGLSCGNPTAIASLKSGEIVLDLGSGGGFDVFIAARKVGKKGRVIGVDMTPDMIAKARRNIPRFSKRTGLNNVEFRLGEIEHLPVADNSMDVVISNCVLNLSPDKPQVWREIGRVLKPGGRAAISDLALLCPLPEAVRQSVAALIGCVAGAVLISELEALAKAAGLTHLQLTQKKGYIESMTDWNDPLYRTLLESLPPGKRLSDYVTSLEIEAIKVKPGLN